MTEEQLVQAASRLGIAAVAELDGEQIALAVLARLAAEPAGVTGPVGRLIPRLVVVLAAAAAILLVLRLTLTGVPGPVAGPDAASPTLSVLHELDDLNASELEVLLESLPPTATAASHPDPASVDQLDAKDLERLLRSLEG